MNTLIIGSLQGLLPDLPRWQGQLYDPECGVERLGAALMESGAETIIYAPPREVQDAARISYALGVAAADVGIKRIVLVSSMGLMASYPENWRIDARWKPKVASPQDLSTLALWLAELSLREIARAIDIRVSIVRISESSKTDAESAILKALDDSERWKIHLVPEPAQESRSFAVASPKPREPFRKIAVLGAGGPLGAVLIEELKDNFLLRLADIQPLDTAKPQSATAPVPVFPGGPHEEVHCDVRDIRSVLDACEGCDAIVNLTVVRDKFADAFAVNTLGAWNVGQAAYLKGIRRIVHTGPQLITLHGENDYMWDWDISADPLPRPGRHLYGHSKYLGQEILRVFAETCGIEVPVLLFNVFTQPDEYMEHSHPMMLSWQDSARAIRAALEVPSLPSPYEVFHCCVNLPHGQMNAHKAKWLLNWEAKDKLESAYG
ncbi:MAG: NAD-dependent epimerase/dehydratase family protein [Armatimonas sp.]